MKHLIVFFLITICYLVSAFDIKGQENNKKGFEVPSKYVSLWFISDPRCPLQLSGETKTIGYSNGGFHFGYTLQNVSKANVENFVIEETNWFGTQGYSHPAEVNKNQLFFPLRTYDTMSEVNIEDLMPFNENHAEKSGIFDKSNKIWIAMVSKVRLSDGTTYDASKKFNQLSDFLIKLNLEFGNSEEELKNKEQKLRDFVSKIMTSEMQVTIQSANTFTTVKANESRKFLLPR